MVNDSKTFLDDKASLEALVDLLPDDARSEYRSYQCLALESAFPSRKLVVYTLKSGRPENIEVVTLGSLRVSASSGPSVEVKTDRAPDWISVGMVPTKLPGRDVFLHVPQKFELRWRAKTSSSGGGRSVNFAAHYAVLLKTRDRPHVMTEGNTYCVRLNQFWDMFPEMKTRF